MSIPIFLAATSGECIPLSEVLKLRVHKTWTICFTCSSFLPPLALQGLLTYVKNRQQGTEYGLPMHMAILSVGLIFAGQIFYMISSQRANMISKRVCTQLRIALIIQTSIRVQAAMVGEIYTKALRLASVSGGEDSGDNQDDANAQVTNLVANDAAHIAQGWSLHCMVAYSRSCWPYTVDLGYTDLHRTRHLPLVPY